jgi:hypothetical protein
VNTSAIVEFGNPAHICCVRIQLPSRRYQFRHHTGTLLTWCISIQGLMFVRSQAMAEIFALTPEEWWCNVQ